MLRPEFYPGAASEVRMLETHISRVFLAGDFAWKIKKPVNLGFADFSTLARRQRFCERELELNRRLAPDMYLEVLPIGRTKSGYRLGERSNVVEYCLKMARFSQDDLLDARLAAGRFDPAWMDALAADIAAFHDRAERNEAMQAYGRPSVLAAHIEANLDAARSCPGIVDASRLAAMETWARETARNRQDAFAARMRARRIRDGHGDLHLRNIALFRGRPTAFDCIEFNDEFRLIDTMNDTAFLVMDCDARNRPDLGFRFLSRYLEHGGDYAGLALLPLFLFYRATVRGKVACLRLAQMEEETAADAPAARETRAEAAAYFELAERYTRAPRPRLFVVSGFSGSGKSRLALQGCGAERAIIIRSDATRKRLARDHPRLPLYGAEMNERTYEAMFAAARTALDAGFPVILDATFLRREDRDRARSLARDAGVECHLYWLDVDEAKLRENITRRAREGRDVSDADLAVLERQLARHQRPPEADIRFLLSAEAWPKA